MSPIAVRWLKFNFVGVIGIGVQMAAFALFYGVLHLDKILATALAVETAVLHNFIWHEKFTWRHLPSGTGWDVAGRLLRFHAGNGLISILGNVAVVQLLSGVFRVNPYVANAIAIAACALANFAVSEWFVFKR